MINVYVGKPGTGKTYSLVHLALGYLRLGRNVYSNFYMDFSKYEEKEDLKGNLFFWTDLSEIIPIKSGEIIIDECQIYMNSRDWKAMPKDLQYKMQQHRKQGLNIHGAVQNVKRIDTVVRELVNSIFQVKKIGKVVMLREYDIEDIDKEKRMCYSTRFIVFSKKLASCYDTLQEIGQNSENIRNLKIVEGMGKPVQKRGRSMPSLSLSNGSLKRII